MNVFGSRLELLAFVQKHIVYKKIRRALQEGTVENYGAFSIVVKDHQEPGWVVKITSVLNIDYYVGVVCEERYRLYLLEDGPDWEHWAGDGCANELYHGDNPETYKQFKDEGLENAEAERRRVHPTGDDSSDGV